MLTYSERKFPDKGLPPTVLEAYKGVTNYQGQPVNIEVYDTAGQEDFGRVRPISYNNCNCFLVCFSLMNADSLDNACTKWYREVK